MYKIRITTSGWSILLKSPVAAGNHSKRISHHWWSPSFFIPSMTLHTVTRAPCPFFSRLLQQLFQVLVTISPPSCVSFQYTQVEISVLGILCSNTISIQSFSFSGSTVGRSVNYLAANLYFASWYKWSLAVWEVSSQPHSCSEYISVPCTTTIAEFRSLLLGCIPTLPV